MKPAVLRPLAEQDLIGIVRCYAQEGGTRLGARAFDAARQALQTVERMPGLRHWGVTRFPIRWFYFERDDQLDVARLLDERRDIAAILNATPPHP